MHKQHGSSLIEVLVAMVIVSFGLLGVAGIIGNALKNSHSSYGRSQASWLANDIVDRMRANRIAAESVGKPYDIVYATTPTGTTVAAVDLIAWRTALSATLPSGSGQVSMNATSLKVTVTVRWDDSRALNGSSSQTFSVETRL
jgi:type IV pilus assembly protein PilV